MDLRWVIESVISVDFPLLVGLPPGAADEEDDQGQGEGGDQTDGEDGDRQLREAGPL